MIAQVSRAYASARLPLDADDIEGACNRAYHTIFDAARAALLTAAASGPADIGKTHSGLISAFSLYLVKHGPVPVRLGCALNRAEEIWLIADYGDSVEQSDAAEMIKTAGTFIEAMRAQFTPE